MVEEQAILAELQRIADEVGATFHRRPWKVVVSKRWSGTLCPGALRRIFVAPEFLDAPNRAKLRFDTTLAYAQAEFRKKDAGFWMLMGVTLLLAAVILYVLIKLVIDEASVSPPMWTIPASLTILPYYLGDIVWRRITGSDAFLHRLLEASKDPEAVREHLKKVKVSAKTLAKFEAMVAAQGYGAPG